MKIFITVILICATSAMFAQHPTPANSNGYKISGQLTNGANAKIYLVEADFFKDVNAKDSTIADNMGRFVFSGKLDGASFYQLQVNGKNGGAGFILENSQMQIKGNADSVWMATLTGSKENDIHIEANKFVEDPGFKKLYDDAEKSMTIAVKSNDSAAIARAEKQKHEVVEKDKARFKAFINKYPTSNTAVNLAGMFIGNFKDLTVADSLFKNFEKEGMADNGQVKYFRNQINILSQLTVGKPAPVFTQADTLGKAISLAAYKGKYVLLDFWASWCGPCRQKSPSLVALSDKYKTKNFCILSISLDEDKSAWLKAIHKDQLNWDHISDLKGWKNAIAGQYAVDSIPQNYLIDPQGNILAVNLDDVQLNDQLGKLLK